MNNFYIILKWIIIYFFVIFIFKKYQPPYLYLIIGLCFLTGFILRKFDLYPGKKEPLLLDFSTFLISFILFILNKIGLKIDIKIAFFFVLIPHLIYNICKTFKVF
ncbi:MAG: hypothetical protein NC827_06315 [Candidatus Omnitrophica bacterium]|nr:hypothetical protein [Candidatus Omnitrophota bacterium]